MSGDFVGGISQGPCQCTLSKLWKRRCGRSACWHRCRTPLNGIVGIIDIPDTHELCALVRQWIYLIAQSSELLQTVVDDILDLSKKDADRLNVESRPFNLPECLEQAVRLFSARAHQRQTLLSYIPSADLPDRVLGDRHRMQQIVMNLVSNAVKYTEGGEIVVRCSFDAELLRLRLPTPALGLPTPISSGKYTGFLASAQADLVKHAAIYRYVYTGGGQESA